VIDSHTHLTSCKGDPEEIVARAEGAGVTRMLTVGLGHDSNPRVVELADRFASVFASVGKHPTDVGGFSDEDAAAIDELAGSPGVRAIGETGLDYYRAADTRADQHRALRAHAEIAGRHGLPLVIHMRDTDEPGEGRAVAECFEILGEAASTDVILHCFSASVERAREAAERGWYVSFAGNATYPQAAMLREAAAAVPDELVLVETDAPYLTPQPHRGDPNEPAFVVETAKVIAEARGQAYDELDALVEANGTRLFRW
jgi:TatD DNase family protein